VTTAAPRPAADALASGPRWWAFAAVCSAYLMVTAGEALLSPVFPIAADDVGLDLALAGFAFAVLTASIAVASIGGGMLLHRWSATRVIQLSLGFTAAGSVAAALAHRPAPFLAAQVLIGVGAGTFFAPGVFAAGSLAGERHRGRAMATFGVAFSGGLTIGALFAALGDRVGWRLAFWLAAGLSLVAMVLVGMVRDMPASDTSGPVWSGLRAVVGVPTFVGVVGAIAQYGTVVFLPAFAVKVWGWSGAAAAVLLAAARVCSVGSKLLAGWGSDRFGARATAAAAGVVLTATGLGWAALPWPVVAAASGAVFAATTSGLFPLANLLAFESFGRQGSVLGTFRAVQMGAGALAGVAVGGLAALVGLRPVIAGVSMVPLALLALRGHRRDSH
jgi:predicted MFS family arabinose efflux permease